MNYMKSPWAPLPLIIGFRSESGVQFLLRTTWCVSYHIIAIFNPVFSYPVAYILKMIFFFIFYCNLLNTKFRIYCAILLLHVKWMLIKVKWWHLYVIALREDCPKKIGKLSWLVDSTLTRILKFYWNLPQKQNVMKQL